MKKAVLKTMGVALSAVVLMSGCSKINKDATLVTIKTGEGTEDTISLGYGNFVARYQQSLYDQYLLGYYGETMWSQDMTGTGSTMEDSTKDSVLNDLKSQYVSKQHAEEYNVALTEEQTTAIADATAKFMADNSEDTIKELGATEEYIKQYLTDRTIYKEVSDAAKEKLGEDISEDQYWMRTFSYVMFNTTKTEDDGTVTDLSFEEISELKDQAEKIADAEDFEAAAEEIGVSVSEYSYLKGEKEDDVMDKTVIKAAEKLKEGHVSKVIAVEGDAIYVLKLKSAHDEEASKTKLESLESDAFDELLTSWTDEFDWTVNEKAWKKVSFDTLFKAVEQESEDTETEVTEETENK